MEIIICKDANAVAELAARMIISDMQKKPNIVLGLATGSTPVSLYKKLISAEKSREVSFRKVTTFNLDEYVGLKPTNPQSYRAFMNENLFHHVNINIKNTHIPKGDSANPLKEGPAYERKIKRAGGIDLQILGIGANGHVGFNEPTSSLGSRTRVKALTERTIRDNNRFFTPGEFQPQLAITMGIQTILEAKRIILLATGASKARAVADAAEGPVSAMCPASALQFHPKTCFIVDEEAATELKLKDYYKWVRAHQESLETQARKR
jgi:glucosamine-6-phosphate deaminase